VLSFRRGSIADREFWRRAWSRATSSTGDLETALALMKKHARSRARSRRARLYGADGARCARAVPALAVEATRCSTPSNSLSQRAH